MSSRFVQIQSPNALSYLVDKVLKKKDFDLLEEFFKSCPDVNLSLIVCSSLLLKSTVFQTQERIEFISNVLNCLDFPIKLFKLLYLLNRDVTGLEFTKEYKVLVHGELVASYAEGSEEYPDYFDLSLYDVKIFSLYKNFEQLYNDPDTAHQLTEKVLIDKHVHKLLEYRAYFSKLLTMKNFNYKIFETSRYQELNEAVLKYCNKLNEKHVINKLFLLELHSKVEYFSFDQLENFFSILCRKVGVVAEIQKSVKVYDEVFQKRHDKEQESSKIDAIVSACYYDAYNYKNVELMNCYIERVKPRNKEALVIPASVNLKLHKNNKYYKEIEFSNIIRQIKELDNVLNVHNAFSSNYQVLIERLFNRFTKYDSKLYLFDYSSNAVVSYFLFELYRSRGLIKLNKEKAMEVLLKDMRKRNISKRATEFLVEDPYYIDIDKIRSSFINIDKNNLTYEEVIKSYKTQIEKVKKLGYDEIGFQNLVYEYYVLSRPFSLIQEDENSLKIFNKHLLILNRNGYFNIRKEVNPLGKSNNIARHIKNFINYFVTNSQLHFLEGMEDINFVFLSAKSLYYCRNRKRLLKIVGEDNADLLKSTAKASERLFNCSINELN